MRGVVGAARAAWLAATLAACGGTTGIALVDEADPRGDVRLGLERSPEVTAATFDLEHLTLAETGEGWELTATFATPVPTLTEVRAARDRLVTMVPQTIDVYLDTTGDDRGHLTALPGRGFRLPASQGWEKVLVVSSLDDLTEDDVVYPLRVTTRGRKLVALFAKGAVPAGVRGILAVVLAPSTAGDGRVRPIGRGGGDCQVWDDTRCTLVGKGPPILDVLGAADVGAGRPVALTYRDGARPVPSGVPVVFARGPLVGVAPVPPDVANGRLATLVDAAGMAIATGVVVSVIGDTASLEVMGGGSGEGAATAVFAAPGVH